MAWFRCGSGSGIQNLKVYSGKVDKETGIITPDNNYCYSELFDAPNGNFIFDLGETSESQYVAVIMCSNSGERVNHWNALTRFRIANHATYYSQAPKLRLAFRAINIQKICVVDTVNSIVYGGNAVVVNK